MRGHARLRPQDRRASLQEGRGGGGRGLRLGGDQRQETAPMLLRVVLLKTGNL